MSNYPHTEFKNSKFARTSVRSKLPTVGVIMSLLVAVTVMAGFTV